MASSLPNTLLFPAASARAAPAREALRNVREAIELCLEVRDQEGWDLAPRYDLTRVKIEEPKKLHKRPRPKKKAV
jgi:hypothetical protein